MECPKCGYTIDKNALVCPNCKKVLKLIKGSYSLVFMCQYEPDKIICTKKDNPLVIGLGEGENFIASDIPAILKHTRNIFRLGERELAILTKDGVTVMDSYGERITHEIEHVEWDVDAAEKGGYPHFMIKEIMEQPGVIERTIESRLKDGKISFGFKHITDEELGMLQEASESITMENMESIIESKVEAVKDTEKWLEENREMVEQYQELKHSEAYRALPVVQLFEKLKRFLQESDYYERVIPLLRRMSPDYDEYYRCLIDADAYLTQDLRMPKSI